MPPLSRLVFLTLVSAQVFSLGLCLTMMYSTLSFTSLLAEVLFVTLGIGSYLGLFFYCSPGRPSASANLARATVSCLTGFWFLVSLAAPAANHA
jgi:hypothetical protein